MLYFHVCNLRTCGSFALNPPQISTSIAQSKQINQNIDLNESQQHLANKQLEFSKLKSFKKTTLTFVFFEDLKFEPNVWNIIWLANQYIH